MAGGLHSLLHGPFAQFVRCDPYLYIIHYKFVEKEVNLSTKGALCRSYEVKGQCRVFGQVSKLSDNGSTVTIKLSITDEPSHYRFILPGALQTLALFNILRTGL